MSGALLRALALLLLLGFFYGAYKHGQSVKDAEWRARWSARDAGDKQAWALAEAEERDKDLAYQRSITKAMQDGQRIIDSAVADATAARNALGMREQADRIASRAASKVSGNSCTSTASQAATRAVMVFADVLKRVDQRAGELAADADQSRGRGLTCEQTFEGLGKRSD
ncbi:DUF2514 family protein [Pseudomonas piscis]|uniref:DUF2514 family protein n=1 Tax=Pseudomonas piscis TaxID=2614538 RepID=UPI00384E1B46